jgi:hypothetical protein
MTKSTVLKTLRLALTALFAQIAVGAALTERSASPDTDGTLDYTLLLFVLVPLSAAVAVLCVLDLRARRYRKLGALGYATLVAGIVGIVAVGIECHHAFRL